METGVEIADQTVACLTLYDESIKSNPKRVIPETAFDTAALDRIDNRVDLISMPGFMRILQSDRQYPSSLLPDFFRPSSAEQALEAGMPTPKPRYRPASSTPNTGSTLS